MSKLYNLARVTTATVGTGTITLGSAVSGLLTFAQAGISDGDVVTYGIADGVNCEVGMGTYTSSGTTLSRDLILRSSGSGNNTAISLSGAAQVFITPPAEALNFDRPNIVLNGAMEIDQQNEGASVAALYVVDGWQMTKTQGGSGPAAITALRDTVVPAGFVNSLKTLITGAAYTGATQAGDFWIFLHTIEANELVDTSFGTANAKDLSLSFWLRTSVTGNYGVTLRNAAGNRCFITMVSTVANTYKFFTIRIPGDTAGTWVTSGTALGASIIIALAAGSTFQGTAGAWQAGNVWATSGQTQLFATASATANLTGVKLEIGSTSTPFVRLPYQQEFARCQRQYEKSYAPGTVPVTTTFVGASSIVCAVVSTFAAGKSEVFQVTKRATPTMTFYSPNTGASAKIFDSTAGVDVNSIAGTGIGTHGFPWLAVPNANGTTATLYCQWTADARL